MSKKTVSSSMAQNNLESLIQEVNEKHTTIEIIDDSSDNHAVLVGLSDWRAIQETLYLEQTGTLSIVRAREKDDSGTIMVEDIDWDAFD